jgi:hypothetical protein
VPLQPGFDDGVHFLVVAYNRSYIDWAIISLYFIDWPIISLLLELRLSSIEVLTWSASVVVRLVREKTAE